MRKIFCDRCGKEIEFPGEIRAYKVLKVSDSDVVDLCDECYKPLRRYIDCERRNETL
jgi:hypothetical protein